jgi:hypothetical protein
LVTDLLSDDHSSGGGGADSRLPPFRYSDKFEEMCAYYMSIGMTYDEYWNGDNLLPRYYRQMDELRKERMNYESWLQGVYIYEALINAAPVLNALSARKKPFPYRDTPIPITQAEDKRLKEQEKEKLMKNGVEAMRIMMADFNKRFNEKKGGNNDGS